jgi:hypothetical protein
VRPSGVASSAGTRPRAFKAAMPRPMRWVARPRRRNAEVTKIILIQPNDRPNGTVSPEAIRLPSFVATPKLSPTLSMRRQSAATWFQPGSRDSRSAARTSRSFASFNPSGSDGAAPRPARTRRRVFAGRFFATIASCRLSPAPDCRASAARVYRPAQPHTVTLDCIRPRRVRSDRKSGPFRSSRDPSPAPGCCCTACGCCAPKRLRAPAAPRTRPY